MRTSGGRECALDNARSCGLIRRVHVVSELLKHMASATTRRGFQVTELSIRGSELGQQREHV